MYLIIFISVLVVTLLWILLGPIIIYLDTQENRYQVGLPGIIKAAVVPTEEIFHIRGWLFFIPFKDTSFPSEKERAQRRRSKERKNPGGKEKQFKWSEGKNLLRNILGSFRVKRMDLDIDTDDFMLNAWLVPAFSSVNSEHIHMQVNFEGNASLMLNMQTRLGALAWALIKTKYQSLFNY